mgnify:CR=1 FL=1
MIAVSNFKYFYCRNGRYYLRLKLKEKQIWLSLKTEAIDVAVRIWFKTIVKA